MDFERTLGETRVIPVVEIPGEEAALPLAKALAAGGLPCAEVTFRTDAAAGSIAAIAAGLPEFLIGAGTVLTTEQAAVAVEAGARFLVSPGYDESVVEFARERGVAVLPGVCTPTEITRSVRAGLRVVKLFPAEAMGGIAYLQSVAAPFRQVRFVPTGGIGPANLSSYLLHPQVLACGGSWMVKKEIIAAGDFDGIRRLVAEAVALSSACGRGA